MMETESLTTATTHQTRTCAQPTLWPQLRSCTTTHASHTSLSDALGAMRSRIAGPWGDDLASVTSYDEFNAIVATFSGSTDMWIGLSDTAVEGAWAFSDGSSYGSFPLWEEGNTCRCCIGWYSQ